MEFGASKADRETEREARGQGAYGEGGEGGGRRAGAALAGGLEQREVLALLGAAGLPRRDGGPVDAAPRRRDALRRSLPPQQVPERHAPGTPSHAPRRRRRRRHRCPPPGHPRSVRSLQRR